MSNLAVNLILMQIKQYVSEGKREFVTRNYELPNGEKKSYMDELLELGIRNVQTAWSEILTLKPKHFEDGPINDYDNPNDKDIWIFKKKINNVTTYIKLKVNEQRGTVCISFHKDRPN